MPSPSSEPPIDLHKIWSSHQNADIRISEFIIKGNKRTKEEVFINVFQPAFESKTVAELTKCLAEGTHRFSKVDSFENVYAVIDNGNLPGTAKVTIHCKEKGLYQL